MRVEFERVYSQSSCRGCLERSQKFRVLTSQQAFHPLLKGRREGWRRAGESGHILNYCPESIVILSLHDFIRGSERLIDYGEAFF